jgi:glycosyltransferase involved in cell wall biosynthesis
MNGRIGIVRDFREEGWPSMDLVVDQLLEHWPTGQDPLEPVDLHFPYRRPAGKVPLLRRSRAAATIDRAYNRYVSLPKHLRTRRADFDFFHIADHSYAHLVHELPPERTGVYCHDLDAFRCLLEPKRERRGWAFRQMTKRLLDGLKKAAVVFHSTRAVGDALQSLEIVAPRRLCLAPYGVEFADDISATADAASGAVDLPRQPFLLHVGSCIPRKRIDVLLHVFAELRATEPDLRLVKIGADWTPAQNELLKQLNLTSFVTHLGFVDRAVLAAAYRKAALTVVPSDAEGFGLPVIEALACGGAVLASDLPTLREAGGPQALYAPVADVPAWTEMALSLLQESAGPAATTARIDWARQFTWDKHAQTVADAYRRLAT